jgi:hypothetical protein
VLQLHTPPTRPREPWQMAGPIFLMLWTCFCGCEMQQAETFVDLSLAAVSNCHLLHVCEHVRWARSTFTNQQQPLLFWEMELPAPTLMLPPGRAPCAGCAAKRFLISAAIVMNACSTLLESLADVSRKGMPSSFAKSCTGGFSASAAGLVR